MTLQVRILNSNWCGVLLVLAWLWAAPLWSAESPAEPPSRAERTAIDQVLQALGKAMSAGDVSGTLALYDAADADLTGSVARDVGALRGRSGLDVSLRLASLQGDGKQALAVVLRTVRYQEQQRLQVERSWQVVQLRRAAAQWRIADAAELEGTRATSNDLDIELLPEQGRLRGVAVLQIRIDVGGADSLLLELNRGLEVTELLDEQRRPLRFEREAGSIVVPQPRPLRAGETRVLRVRFAGPLFNESQEQGYSQVAITPRGSFASWVTGWYPRLAGTASKSPGRLRYLVPRGITVASNGRLEETSSSPAGERFSFKVDRPLDFSFAAAPYMYRALEVDGIQLGVYLLRGDAAKLDLYLQQTARTLHTQRTLYGSYPFEGYALVEIPAEETGVLGGSSEQGMNLFPIGTLPDDDFPLPLVAHEMGHSWWGNLVKAQDSAMLDEGLAQFTAMLCMQAHEGEAAMRSFAWRGTRNFSQSAQAYFERIGRPPALDYALGLPPSSADVAAILHDMADTKGMLIYSMLRDLIGQEAMLRGLQTLTQQFADRSLALVDLQRALEQASGRKLAGFFQQWLMRTGAPELRLETLTLASRDGFVTTGSVTQVGQPYELEVDIVLASHSGRQVQRLRIADPVTRFAFTSERRPDWVVLDPEHKVLRWTPELRHERLLDEGRVLMSLGREGAAIAKFQDFLARAPDSLIGRAELGRALAAKQRLREAEQHFQRVLDYYQAVQVHEPAVTLSQLYLGHVLDLTGRRDAALTAYQRTLALPDAGDAHATARAARETPYRAPTPLAAPSRATLQRFVGNYDNQNGIALSVHLSDQDVLQIGEGNDGTPLEWLGAARFRLPGTGELIEFGGQPPGSVLLFTVGDSVIKLPRKR